MNSEKLIETVTGRLSDKVLASHAFRGDATLILNADALLEAARFVKDDPALAMNLLVDITCVDYSTFGEGATPAFFDSSGVSVQPSPLIPDKKPWPGPPGEERFAMVYHFYSMEHKHRLRFVAPLEESDAAIDSLCSLWPAANWLEREVWDMFGIKFHEHPDLRRILMYPEFKGHPLRKDYPVNKRQPLIGPLN